jgi:hypothetical protein
MNHSQLTTQYDIQHTKYEIQSTKNYVRIYQQIMQNKPNVKDVKIYVSPFTKIVYVKIDTWLNRKNKPNQTQFKPKTNPISKMPKISVNIYYKREYNNEIAYWRMQNKPKQSQYKPNFKPYPEHSRMGQFKPLSYLSNGHMKNNCSCRLLIYPMSPLYKPHNVQYYSWYNRRCSSMVEHSFRKAGVEGPTPSIGCSVYMRAYILRESAYGNSN